METIRTSDHVITDEHVQFIQDAMEYWMIHKPKKERRDRDHYHHLNYVLNRIKTSPIIQTINYKRTKKL